MQCAKCGAGNRDQAKFCEECGAALALACPQCGAAILVGKKFCGDCGASLFSSPLASAQVSAFRPPPSPASHTPPHLASRILSGKTALEGERKFITVLFADIKGSMDIMENLDPETSKKLLDPCIHLMMNAVYRAEGAVSRVLGDGVMALFGAPLALEDHPHRALYAALHMQEAARRYAATIQQQYEIELRIRVGINTGEVVVGAIGTDLFMEYTPVGHAVGLAARMEALAAPGSTFVTASTYALTQHAFRFVARGTTKVKGAKEPIVVYELLGPEPTRSRLSVRAARGFAPFVDRTRELAHLQDLAARAAGGHGQTVLLSGEAGIGKSRLLEELKPSLHERGFLLIEGEGFAYGKTRSYLPLINMLKRYCGITDHDSSAAYREKLQNTLTRVHASLAAFTPMFLDLLGVQVDDASLANLSPEAKLKQILNGTKQLIALQCRLQPVALLIEDLHWLDVRSITFLHALMTSTATLPVLLLCSSRPEPLYPWETQSFVQKLSLTPLSPEGSASLFTALIGEAADADVLTQVVCQRSGGNPFFLEEIIQDLRETGALMTQVVTPSLATAATEWRLPPTVQGVLASRLDRLPMAAKSLLQTAAVIGREASRSVLARVSDLEEAEFEHALDILQARELVYESAIYPESLYAFKHALIQEVAYHGLLQEHRTLLHERVGATLEIFYADKLTEHASLLAYHYSRSANTAKALHYLQLAGRRASSLYADTDAQYFWEEFLRLLATQPHTTDRDRQEIRIRMHLINVLSRQHNDDTPIRAQFVATEALCQRLHDGLLLAELHATLAVAYILRGQPKRGLPHARAAKEVADTRRDPRLQVITAGPLAHLLWLAGSFEEALLVAESGLSLIDAYGLAQEQMGFVIHPHAHCHAIEGICRGFLGDFERGVSALREAVELTQRHGNRMPQAVVHWGLALLFDLYGHRALALQESEQALKIMEEVSPITGVLLVGCLQEYLRREPSVFIDASEKTSEDSKLTQTWNARLAFYELAGAWLAELAAHFDRGEEARRLAHAALKEAEASGSRWFLCVASLTCGRLLANTSQEGRDEAETYLQTALALATQIRSLPFIAHAAVELGALLLRKGAPLFKKQAGTYLRQALELSEQFCLPHVRARTLDLLSHV